MSFPAIALAVVGVFGVVIAVLSVWGCAFPQRLVTLVRGVMSKRFGMPLAVGVRIALGLALLVAAPAARFPVAFQALGWIALIAAAVLPIVGRDRIDALIGWLQNKPPALMRVWLLFGVLFGAFLVYGAYA